MDPDYLADEVERQREERERLGPTPEIRAVIFWMVSAAVTAILAQPRLNPPSPLSAGDLLEGVATGAVLGAFIAFGSWIAARRARRKCWASNAQWAAAFGGGIIALLLLMLLLWPSP
jgi:hypothetical protein